MDCSALWDSKHVVDNWPYIPSYCFHKSLQFLLISILLLYPFRASFIRNHNNNSLYPPSPLRFYSTKSSDSDLSSYAPSPPLSRLPLPQTESGHASTSSSPAGGRRYFQNGQRSLLTPPTSVHSDGPYFTFSSANSGSPSSSVPSPGAMSNGGGRELVPIALAKCKQDGSLGFSLMAGGQGGRTAVVKRVWDRQQCNSLQPGDAIVKINGADVQSLNFIQVQRGRVEIAV